MVILFSFALVASILTMVNVGVNESGRSSLSTVTSAQAAGDDIGYDGDVGQVVPIPSVQGCLGGCGPATTPVPGVAVSIPNTKSVHYGCKDVDGAGNCNVAIHYTRDAVIRTEKCRFILQVGGTKVATGGPAAVTWLKNHLVGKVWRPSLPPERMMHHLTGAELGWLIKPVGWSDVANASYNGAGEQTEGDIVWGCNEPYVEQHIITYQTRGYVCPPKNDGRPFPYSVGLYVTYRDMEEGRMVAGGISKDWQLQTSTCIYVSANTPPPKVATVAPTCYWNIQHYGYFSTNRAAIQSGGTATTNRPSSPYQNAQKPYVSGKSSTAQLHNCTQEIRMDANLSLSDGYAYYRLQGNADYEKYQYYIWDKSYTGGRELTADIQLVDRGVVSKKVFGTHSCATNPPYHEYGSWGSLPNISFNYSDCKRDTEWSCKIPHSPRINGVDNAVQLMRDGNYIRTDLGGVNISGNGVRDINSKSVGTVADGNMSYMVRVMDGSSPFNGTNANAEKQYFELWKNDQKTETQWNTWLSSPNANKTNYLSFYWSSDNGAKWQMTYQAKINTAEFAVPWQESTQSGAGTKWMPESNVDCAGVKASNQATVLRSVSSDGR